MLAICHRGSESPEKSLKYKRVLWGVHYGNLKTELLSPEAALYQQLEFHWAAEDGEMQETGDALEVWEACTKPRGLCGRLRNAPSFKTALLKTLWCATLFSLLSVTNTWSWGRPQSHSYRNFNVWVISSCIQVQFSTSAHYRRTALFTPLQPSDSCDH